MCTPEQAPSNMEHVVKVRTNLQRVSLLVDTMETEGAAINAMISFVIAFLCMQYTVPAGYMLCQP
jgi:hypothetical protein